MSFIPFPDIDPVIFSVDLFGFTLAIRWYALAYIAGLLLGWRYVIGLCDRAELWAGKAPAARAQVDDLLTWMIVGVIVGGRLGYVFFYQPGYYLAHPGEILAAWNGGMSFHGGFLGVAVATLLFCLRNNLPVLSVGDLVAAAAPIGLFFGRAANFINAELWGKPTTQPWAVVFPGNAANSCPVDWVGPCARHPSQLYEAGLEGLVLFFVLFWMIRRGALQRPGLVTGVFLIGYSLSRMFVELFREADAQYISDLNPLGHVLRFSDAWGMSMGQILSLPMLFAGIVFVVLSGRSK